MSVTADALLRQTLSIIGVDVLETDGIKQLVVASPDLEDISRAYRQFNASLEEAEDAPYEISHLSGEGSALVDRQHRAVVRRHYEVTRSRHRLACYFDHNGIPDVWQFVACQRPKWRSIEWFDMIDILGLAADRAMAIYVLPSMHPVHFSLIGRDRLLLQAEHTHPTLTKWVWYLDAPQVVAKLRVRLESAFGVAHRLPAMEFQGVLDWLYSRQTLDLALAYAARVSEHSGDAIGSHTSVSRTDGSAGAVTSRLEALGFMSDGALTEMGTSWLAEATGIGT
jgi:hypothetical protein